MVFSLTPAEIGIVPTQENPNAWGVVMEMSFTDVVVTLLSLLDGTTSLYFSHGGGIIGGGQHETVAQASRYFVTICEAHLPGMTLTDSYPPPLDGKVKFYIFTFSGTYTTDAPEDELDEGTHELSGLFYTGQEVITQLRLMQERSGPS